MSFSGNAREGIGFAGFTIGRSLIGSRPLESMVGGNALGG